MILLNPCAPANANDILKGIDAAVEALEERGYNRPLRIGVGIMQMKALREFAFAAWQAGLAKRFPGGDQFEEPALVVYQGMTIYCACLENDMVFEGVAR